VIKVGINGGFGFIGYHLWLYLTYKCNDIDVIRLSKELTQSEISNCDIIFHMAEQNSGDVNELYKNNTNSAIKLTNKLNEYGVNPKIIYTSSIHQNIDNLYGKWRRDNIDMFLKKGVDLTVVQLPNIFGPFCKPNYNSFIATFCDTIINGDNKLKVNDSKINLLYVDNLCKQLYEVIKESRIELDVDITTSVNEIHNLLLNFKEKYINNGEIPLLNDDFEINLFNTFRSYIKDDNLKTNVKINVDSRGVLSELMISRIKGQIFYSTTNTNCTRGNHFHTKRIERFCVLSGTALIQIRKVGTDKIIEYYISGDDYQVIDIPVCYTHNLKNIGNTTLICCFWMNDILSEQTPDDTYYEIV
jgi:UDP-2-acetamido-2,6-beta-L-arabino-hexul-4-ose reductase